MLLLTHFIRSLLALALLALLSLTSFAPRLLTHFVRSLCFRSLTSFIPSWHLLRLCFCCSLRLLLACSLTSLVHCAFAHSLCSFPLGACFTHAFVAHFVCSSLAHSLRLFAALLLTHFVRSLALLSLTSFTPRLLTHFVHSLRFRSLTSFVRSCHSLRLLLACSLTSFVRSHFAALRSCILLRSIQSLGWRLSIKKPNCLHYHFLQFAHTIAMSILPEEGAHFGSLRLSNHLYHHIFIFACAIACTITFSIRLCNLFVPKNFSIKLSSVPVPPCPILLHHITP